MRRRVGGPWKILLIVAAMLVMLVVGAAVFVQVSYRHNLNPVSSSQEIVLVTIPSGSSIHDISTLLKDKGLIRQQGAFEWYVRGSEYRDKLQAGTYALRRSQGVKEIVQVIAQGKIATDLVTILPGQRIDQVRAALINSGFTPDDVTHALDPASYADHPALVDKPPTASLEGYLYPDSFQRTVNSSAAEIVRASLDEMQKRYTPELRTAIAAQGLSPHEGVILASIVEKEVSKPADRPIVASVFLNRLRQGIRLGSDVTILYGAILDGKEPKLSYDSAYNTHTHNGLPPGPISNISADSLTAVAHPANTDYLYFVSGDDGKTYFAHTIEEHNANIDAYCKKLCSGG